MDQGELVMVRAVRGEPLVRRIVEIGHEGVLVCREETWKEKRMTDGRSLPAAGFPKGHVFRYDPGLYSDLRQAYNRNDLDQLDVLWAQAAR